MLSAFLAQQIVELKQRDKSKIESILAYGDRLVVGLNTGSLRIYRVNEIQDGGLCAKGDGAPPLTLSSAPALKPVDLLREIEKFSSRSIEQLSILKIANILISLSNYIVSIHDLHSYTLLEQLPKTKNATTFAVTSNIVKDADTGIPEIISRLAVAVKRRLLLWSWHESELAPDIVEITLPTAIRTLCWASESKIICGMNSGYVVVDVLTKDIGDIVGPGAIGGAAGSEGGRFGGVGSASMGYMGLGGYAPKPHITRLRDGEILLAKDINSLFVNGEGKSLDKKQIPWQQAPESIGYSYPYLLSLQPPAKGTLEVRNPDTLSLLQAVSLPGASILHFPPPTVSLAHAGKGFYVASERCVWRMGVTDYDAQIDQLVEENQFDEAISILNILEDALLPDKLDRLREIKMQKAHALFDQRKYRAALDLFKEVSAPPERVIKLYPAIIAGDLAVLPTAGADQDDCEVKEHDGGTTDMATETPVAGSPIKGLVNNFIKQHKKSSSDVASVVSVKTSQKPDLEGSETASIKIKLTEEGPLEGKDLINAVRELNGFLVDTRTRLQRFIDPVTCKLRDSVINESNGTTNTVLHSLLLSPASATDIEVEEKLLDTAQLVDTTLFRAYMLVQPSLAGSLFRIPNFCDPNVVNEKLLESHRYNDLVDFFHGKKLHREALEMLRNYGECQEEADAAASLRGPQRTVGYLQNLPAEMIDLILEFAEWPLRTNPDLGMDIFLADTENAETLPREKVVAFLESVDIDLAVRYLEHITSELNDTTPDFHNRLVYAYMQDLIRRSDRERDSWKALMQRSLSFLRSSKQYSVSKALGLIPKNDSAFFEARAIVLSNMGQHKQALEIYVFDIKDFGKAEDYCNQVFMQSESSSDSPTIGLGAKVKGGEIMPSLYHTLLSLYLTPPPPHQPNWPPALELLAKHGSRLPASSTLGLIPATLPVKDLEGYFRGRIRAANSVVNGARVIAGMRKSEVVKAQADLLLGDEEVYDPTTGLRKGLSIGGSGSGRNRHVVISEVRVCGVCHKRLGRSVVSALPDNTVVHYGCSKRGTQKVGK